MVAYIPTREELDTLRCYMKLGDPFLLIGPIVCGKTALVEHIARKVQRSLETLIRSRDKTILDLPL